MSELNFTVGLGNAPSLPDPAQFHSLSINIPWNRIIKQECFYFFSVQSNSEMEALFCCLCCCYYCCFSEPKKKFRLEFQLVVQNILFTRNEAFLPRSSYIIYTKKKKGQKVYNKIKTSKQNSVADDPTNVQINDCMKMKTTLKQTLADKYLEQYRPKQMKLKIRQKTKTSSLQSCYRDIGYIVLDLHTLASSASDQEYDFPLVDPKGKCDAVVRIRVLHSFVHDKKWCGWMALTCRKKRKRELSTSRLAVNQNVRLTSLRFSGDDLLCVQ